MSLKLKITIEERFWSKVQKGQDNECWIWLASRIGPTKSYGGFSWKNRKSTPAHRASYMLNVGEIPEGMDIMHKCDNGLCVNPKHLEVGTRKQNMQQAVERNRLKPYDRHGEKNSNAKLSLEDVIKIKQYLKEGYTQQSIANQFRVNQTQISCIKLGKSW